MSHGARTRAAWLCGATLLWPAHAGAQELTIDVPRAEIAAGFAFVDYVDVNVRPTCVQLQLPCGSGKTFGDYGGVLSASVQVVDGLSIVGETGLFANMWQTAGSLYSTTNQVRAALAGMRVSSPMFRPWRRDPQRMRVFGQLLYGVVTSDAAPGGRAVQPGVGADFSTRYPIRLRVHWDYTFVQHGLRDLSASRIGVALVVPVG